MAHEDIYEQFMAKIIERTKLIKRGNPLDTDTMIGGNIEEVHTDYENGFYIPPTLLKGTNKMRIFQEEIFGPVIAVTTFKTEAEALELANDSEFGLGAGVWSRDMNVAYRMGRKIQAGRVWTNCYHIYPAFGGYKKSGLGRETHKVTLEHYQQTKIYWSVMMLIRSVSFN